MTTFAAIQIGNGNIEHETEKAILFDFGWMPKSQILLDIERGQYDAHGYVICPVWLAKKLVGWNFGKIEMEELSWPCYNWHKSN